MPYQQHEYDEKDFETKRHWIEYVYPRKKIFQGKLIVLVGHWTGSMGEGMAIGFDSFKKPLVVGTKMAGLLGAIEGFNLKETNINFQIPTERLYHVNGKPRENYTPKIQTTNEVQTWSYILKVK
jgi:carboxyl-terminal processing protease